MLKKRHFEVSQLEQIAGVKTRRNSLGPEDGDSCNQTKCSALPKNERINPEKNNEIMEQNSRSSISNRTVYSQSKLIQKLNQPKLEYEPKNYQLYSDYRGLICADNLPALEQVSLRREKLSSSKLSDSKNINITNSSTFEGTRNKNEIHKKLLSTMQVFPVVICPGNMLVPHASCSSVINFVKPEEKAFNMEEQLKSIKRNQKEREEKEKIVNHFTKYL